MRVLVCIPCLMTGGTEIQTLSLVEALVGAGHTVGVACYFEYALEMADRYRRAGAEVILLSPEGVRPVGIRATIAHLWRGLRGAVKGFRPDAAHVQYMAPGAFPIIILKALGVKRIIATSHTDGDIYSPNGLRVIRLLSATCLTAFQCITERAERSYFGSSSLFSGKLRRHFTIYNNIPSHITLREEPRRPLDPAAPVIIGVVSRLEHIKGMDLVVPAFAIAAGRNPRLRLLVAGDGSQRPLMEAQAREAGIADRVEFIGRQPQTALPAVYDSIDILLMPSRSEGFGLTAIEGMARGCVPVVSEVGGLPEVVTPGTGLLLPLEDVAALAERIERLAADPSLLSSLSAAALRRARVFSPSAYAAQIKQLYAVL